jgi:hypothetical protein
MRSSFVVAILVAVQALAISCAPAQSRSAPALAESVAGRGGGNRCDSLPPVGTRMDTVFGTVTIEPDDPALAGWEAMLLDGLRMYFQLPPRSRVPVYNGVSRVSSRSFPDTISLYIRGEADVELERSGKLGSPRIKVSTLSPAIDESILLAVRRLDSAGVIPPFPEKASERSVSIRFEVRQSHDSSSRARPLVLVEQPFWLFAQPVTAASGNPAPDYPADLRQGKIEGDVLIGFVVDQDGLARPETMQVLRKTNSAFVFAVREVLPRLRFHPATIGACPVAQLVQMPFGFRIPK